MEVQSITIMVEGRGPDEIHLETNLPSPYPPEVSSAPLSLKSTVRRGGGIYYARKHFPGIPTVLINMSTGKRDVMPFGFDYGGFQGELPRKMKCTSQHAVGPNVLLPDEEKFAGKEPEA